MPSIKGGGPAREALYSVPRRCTRQGSSRSPRTVRRRPRIQTRDVLREKTRGLQVRQPQPGLVGSGLVDVALVRCHRRWRTQPTILQVLRRTTSTSGKRNTIVSGTTTNSPTENEHVWWRQPQEWLPRARRYRSASGCASIVFLIGSVSIMVVD